MSERASWLVAGVAFHGWLFLLWVEASTMRCFAGLIFTTVWTAIALVKTLDRKGAFG